MSDFLAGATTLACLAVATFFLRYWRDTHDRLFGAFALAFSVFALNRVLLTAMDREDEGRVLVYILRAAAFVVIILAIADKNRGSRSDDA